jgi:hypothetical protein
LEAVRMTYAVHTPAIAGEDTAHTVGAAAAAAGS